MKFQLLRIFAISLCTYYFSLNTSGIVCAQTIPQKFSYQSILRNPGGQALQNQPVFMRLSILQGSETGTAVYVETHSASTNAAGLVSLQVGGGTVVSGSLSAIDWATGPYFIKTETDPEGGSNYSISGTSQLLSVPYALYSANGTPGPQGPQGPAGPQGAAGQNGQNGNNGKNALIRTTPEAAGANCVNGGVKIEAGLDADGNGQLSDAEVNASQTKFICNGSGSSGTGLPSNPPYGSASLYNCDGQFQYSPCVPKVVINEVTLIYSRAASFSGSVSNDGGAAASTVGFCWGTSPNPTTADSLAWLSNNNGTLFSGGEGHLLPATTYYVRAFATNAAGTGYGEQKTFTTPQSSANPAVDADGNTYSTVTIGNQVWMKENLKTSKYRNGNPIPTNLNDNDWASTTSGAYSIFNNDFANNATYGKLYNWYAVADPGAFVRQAGMCQVMRSGQPWKII
jgi:hypothetical protein